MVAQELGLQANQLYAWRKRLAPADAGTAVGAKPGSLADVSQLDLALREIRHLREQRDISKKNVGHSLRTVLYRYGRIDAMKKDHSLASLCANLQVSPSGYYDWQKRRARPRPRAQETKR